MLEQRRDWPEVRRQRVEVAAGEKVVLTLIALSAESAGGAATLMAVPVSTVSATAFYGFPDASCFATSSHLQTPAYFLNYSAQYQRNLGETIHHISLCAP